jgi:hypothetical protein
MRIQEIKTKFNDFAIAFKLNEHLSFGKGEIRINMKNSSLLLLRNK